MISKFIYKQSYLLHRIPQEKFTRNPNRTHIFFYEQRKYAIATFNEKIN